MTEQDDAEREDAVHPPVVDFSGALHMAGHESELLGFDGVEDSAPLVDLGSPDDDDPGGDPRHRFGTDIATRGTGHHE
jgi:hypothetical protein